MIADLLLRNGVVVTSTGSHPGGVAVDKGRIVAVGVDSSLPDAREVIDVGGRYITPGFIDAHTHQGLFYPYGQDVRGQTQLAAGGGITTCVAIERSTLLGRTGVTVVNSPEEVPTYASVYEGARAQVNENAFIDMAFTFAIITDANASEIERCVSDWGVTSFKFYMQNLAGGDGWMSSIGFPPSGFDEGTMYLGFEAIGRIGRPAMATIHAEDRRIERILRERVRRTGRGDLQAWSEVCAPVCEIAAIRQAAHLARTTKAPLYVVHLSTADALPEIDRARNEGTDLTVEVNTPWLCVTTEDDPPGVFGKFLPPLRDGENRERLWEGLRTGAIQCLGTDESSVTRRYKETRAERIALADRELGVVSAYAPGARGPGEPHTVWTVSPATAAVDTYVPALMTYGVLAGRISMERLVEVACENNAKAFALYPRKGSLSVGADADITVIDPKLRRVVEPLPLPQDPGEKTFNFLEGRELAGWPVLTIVRGKIVFRDGAVVGKPGDGQLVERKGYPMPYPWWPR